MKLELKPCPFCGYEKPRLMYRESDFSGKNDNGDKKSKYVFYIKCNKCHSRGKPIKSDYLINANPWIYEWSGEHCYNYDTTKYDTWINKAAAEWNRRNIK